MRKLSISLLCAAALVMPPARAASGQKKSSQCEQAAQTERNWEVIGDDYVYFDYILCPADVKPANPLVKVWLTTRGNGFAVEKWTPDRDGADDVAVFYGTKKAFTLYRDLNAVPLKIFKAESRAGVPADTAKQPLLADGNSLIPFENLTPDSAEKAKKVFEAADILIRGAQAKIQLLRETARIGVIVNSLDRPLKAQK
jgi:hypothetical protein